MYRSVLHFQVFRTFWDKFTFFWVQFPLLMFYNFHFTGAICPAPDLTSFSAASIWPLYNFLQILPDIYHFLMSISVPLYIQEQRPTGKISPFAGYNLLTASV